MLSSHVEGLLKGEVLVVVPVSVIFPILCVLGSPPLTRLGVPDTSVLVDFNLLSSQHLGEVGLTFP